LRCTASRGEYYLDPFQVGLERDQKGKLLTDADGRFVVRFKFDQMAHIVTDAWGGVTKMFPLTEDPCHVAAVTSGPASLNLRTISSVASEYRSIRKKQKAERRKRTVKTIAEEFLSVLRAEYDEHYKDSPLPPEFRDGPEFLVGGFGQGDKFPSSYRVLVKENAVREEFAKGGAGLSWNAQSDAVERIIRGYDKKLRNDVEQAFDVAIKAYQKEMNEGVLKIIDDMLKKLNAKMPSGVDTTLPSKIKAAPPWDRLKTAVPYSALPLQEAVNFVAYLIMMQAGKARVAPGVATVGGRTHVGVITKDDPYRQLNEPELTHHYTGFADDH
jgi:hypothetical protein